MACRYGNGTRMEMLPSCIEDYITENDPVRAYDTFVAALDFNKLGIEINPSKVANSEYDPKGIKVIVPSQRQALHEEPKPFSKQEFCYNKEQDCYYCPEGHRLSFDGIEKQNRKRHYQIINKTICFNVIIMGSAQKGKMVEGLYAFIIKR